MNKRMVGGEAEQMVGRYLTERGYRILAYNFRSRRAECDIVASEGGYLVFIEVKYRSSLREGDPAEAVDARKQRRISEAAMYYLAKHGLSDETPVRFDVAAVEGRSIRIIKNAFPYGGW